MPQILQLSDDDIVTTFHRSTLDERAAADPDGTDADGTDGTDADGTDGTDGADADGTDGADADGTDR